MQVTTKNIKKEARPFIKSTAPEALYTKCVFQI